MGHVVSPEREPMYNRGLEAEPHRGPGAEPLLSLLVLKFVFVQNKKIRRTFGGGHDP